MDFTRHPIIETVITPKEGYRLVVRSSKNVGQEEFFVEAVEVVSFGTSCFFRSLDRTKSFLVPVSDYEITEVRDHKMPLKAATMEGVLRIPSVKEVAKTPFVKNQEKKEEYKKELNVPIEVKEEVVPELVSRSEPSSFDRRKEKEKKRQKKRREKEELVEAEKEFLLKEEPVVQEEFLSAEEPEKEVVPLPSTIIPPPTTLIRDDLERLRNSETYKSAFYPKETPQVPIIPISLQGEEEIIIKKADTFIPIIEEDTYKATLEPLDEPSSKW